MAKDKIKIEKNKLVLSRKGSMVYSCLVCKKRYIYKEDIPQKCKEEHELGFTTITISNGSNVD